MTRRELIGAALAPLAARAVVPDLGWLLGKWQGEGTFFGRPSSATLVAALTLGGRFLELAWHVPGYEGRGLYAMSGETWSGHWFDSSGAARALVATPGAQLLNVAWGSEATERGRSLYARAGDALLVEDSVSAASGWRIFASHRLSRMG